jgi:hypothetical protein
VGHGLMRAKSTDDYGGIDTPVLLKTRLINLNSPQCMRFYLFSVIFAPRAMCLFRHFVNS